MRAAKQMTFTPGKDYDVVVISFDPRETPQQAMAKKQTYMRSFGHPETANGWHFLTGEAASITRVTDAVGFRWQYGPPRSRCLRTRARFTFLRRKGS